jgi:hypothetical protein
MPPVKPRGSLDTPLWALGHDRRDHPGPVAAHGLSVMALGLQQ